MGANSVSAKTYGNYTIKFNDGTEHRLFEPNITISGTVMGDRTFAVTGSMSIEDKVTFIIT